MSSEKQAGQPLVQTHAAAVVGIDAIDISVETMVKAGLQFNIVGLADTTVKESYQRVMSALTNSGYKPGRLRAVVNLAPADIRKEGAAFDLSIALSLLVGTGIIQCPDFNNYMILGELGFDGTVRPIRGVLPMAIRAHADNRKALIVPAENANEAAVVNRVTVYGVHTLREAADIIAGNPTIAPTEVDTRAVFARAQEHWDFDFSEVKGQENVKRAFEVACAGGHNVLLIGPPGSGKSMLAKRIPSILPPLSLSEALQTTKIHSVAGKLDKSVNLLTARPFRSPHHTVSSVAMVGGGTYPLPGEISLANNGVLFLDEFPEFPRTVLEVLRQPLEDRYISVSRAKYSVDYPASFMLVASMNPCPCGYYTHPTRPCTCAPGAVGRYLNRISGPLLDRIDIQCEVVPVPFEELSGRSTGESSASIRQRVIEARRIQEERYANEPGIHCNAELNSRLMAKYCELSPECMKILRRAMEKFDLSARAYDRILKVARTIADLDGEQNICERHITEAVSYRSLDRSSWGASTIPFV